MQNAQKPDHRSLNTIVAWLKEGRFVIPDFQREFEWAPWDISDLMRSIFLDYYIGSLLLWKGAGSHFDALACEPIYAFEGSATPEQIVLDGQQRLTAMFYAFTAPDCPAPNRRNRYLYFIKVDELMEDNHDEAFVYGWTRAHHQLLDQREAQFEKHMFPLAVVGRGGWELGNWVQAYEGYWRERAAESEHAADGAASTAAVMHAERATAFGSRLKDTTEQYQIAFIELDEELALEKVCDIFTQINSKGIRLDVFDLINALLKPKGLQLKHLWREVKPKLDFIESDRLNVYVLQVMSILTQAYCSPKYLYYLLPGQERSIRAEDGSLHKEVLIPDVESFSQLWDRAVKALQMAIARLRHPHEFGVVSSNYLPYVAMLPAFAALNAEVASLPPAKQLDADRKLRHWYWSSVFTSRYSGSVESTAARDFLDLKEWFANDAAEPALIDELKARFRSLELRRENRRGSSVYSGVFNLLVISGARDWVSGQVPQPEELDDHHIVPKDWGKAQPSLDGAIDSILNRTPLTANTNRTVINSRLPNTYLPELIAQNGEAAVQSILDSHFISAAALRILLRDPFTVDDFDAFLAERQRTLQDAIENLLVKERIDLSPVLRELDQRAEHVERSLRTTVLTGLGGNPASLPPHVRTKAGERVQIALRKNPGLDAAHYESLTGLLEYCDLRELQDTITSKSLWPRFDARFGTKEQLSARFAQLAELRNGIAHHRTVDEVTRKDGEAALSWFEGTLSPSDVTVG